MILRVDNCAAFAVIVIEGIEDDRNHWCTHMSLRCCNRDWGIEEETTGVHVPPLL